MSGSSLSSGDNSASASPRPGSEPGSKALASDVLDAAVSAAQAALLAQQHADGHWCAVLEGDSILESEYVLTMLYLGRGQEPRPRARLTKVAEHLRRIQSRDGGWSIYPEGPTDVSASVKAYLVLKLLGDDVGSEPMARARRAILEAGGLEAVNSFTKIYLSIFGLYQWRSAPAVPPELVLFPKWFPFNIYAMSSWSRAIVVPLSIIWAHKPRRDLGVDLDELVANDGRFVHPAVDGLRARLWAGFFRAVDALIKAWQWVPVHPLRRPAVRKAERWILERLEHSDGLGAIFPPIINTIIALDCLGYAQDHPVLASQIRELENLELEDHDTLRIQPCKSPVWDTALAVTSLAGSEIGSTHTSLADAAIWLADRQVTQPGDWLEKNPCGPVGGWYFEYANEFYPDCDDTAEVLKALAAVDTDGEAARKIASASTRGRDWLLSMQNPDGGWASFDRGCDHEWLTYIPFADHNAMIDPSTVDITARVLEALSLVGFDREHPCVVKAVRFVKRMQESDGSWYGRWGCNYLYGTWLALSGLAAAGEDMAEPWARRAGEWIRDVQNPDGGWGELPSSYDDPALKGRGPSTASQTAWALLGLMAIGEDSSPATRRGIDFLLASQSNEGIWSDGSWTGTGFPKVFYLKYHNYALVFPLLALAEYREWSTMTRADREMVA